MAPSRQAGKRFALAAFALAALVYSTASAQEPKVEASSAKPKPLGAASLVKRLIAGERIEGLREGQLRVGPVQVISLPPERWGNPRWFYALDPQDQTIISVMLRYTELPPKVKRGDTIVIDVRRAVLYEDQPKGKVMLGVIPHRIEGPVGSVPLSFVDLANTNIPLKALWSRLVRIKNARVSRIGEIYPEGCDNATLSFGGRKELACFPNLKLDTPGFESDIIAVVEYHPNPDPMFVLFVVDHQRAFSPLQVKEVQDAIDAAKPGDVIVLEKGEYKGGFRVSGKESLTIKGQGSWFKLDNGEQATIEIHKSKHINLEGFNAVHDVQSCTTGGVLTITDSKDVTIRDVYLDGTGLFGAKIKNSQDVAIEDSTLTNCIASGLIVEGSSRITSMRNVIALNGKRELKYYHDHPKDVAGIEIRKSEIVNIVQNTVVANRLMPGIRNIGSKKVKIARSIIFANQGPPVVGDPSETKQHKNFLTDPHFADFSTGDFRLRPSSPALQKLGRKAGIGARPVARDLSGSPYCEMPSSNCRGIAPFAYSRDGKLAYLTWGGPATDSSDGHIHIIDTNTGKSLHHLSTANHDLGLHAKTDIQSWAATQAELAKQVNTTSKLVA